MIYAITLKVYEPANMYELPIRVREKMIDEHGNLKLGYQSFETEMSQEEFEEIMLWFANNESIAKVIGVEKR